MLENASNVCEYAFFPVVTVACLLIKATSKGFPTIAPNMPLAIDKSIFYKTPIVAPLDCKV